MYKRLNTYREIITALRRKGTKCDVYCTKLDLHITTPKAPIIDWLRRGAEREGIDATAVDAWDGEPLHVLVYADFWVSFR